MKHPTNKEQHLYLKIRKEENYKRSVCNKAENIACSILKTSKFKCTRQAVWGYRIFDFWCHKLGVAIEVDGSSHDNKKEYDLFRDNRVMEKSGIIVYRVKNYDVDGLRTIMTKIDQSKESWNDRRKNIGKKPIFNADI